MKKKRSLVLTVYALVCLFALSGCYLPERAPQIVSAPSRPPITLAAVQRRLVGRSVENRPIESIVIGQGRDVTLILGTIHGDEEAGTPLAERLAEYVQEQPELLRGRKVVILPTANPDGVVHSSRFNARGVDLNRNFAAANWQRSPRNGYAPFSEPETGIIRELIRQHGPDRIVSIHQRLQDASACIDYDGPGRMLAERMAQHCNVPINRFGAQSGSLGSYAGVTLRIPTITLELPRNAHQISQDTLWQQYGNALLAALVYPEHLR